MRQRSVKERGNQHKDVRDEKIEKRWKQAAGVVVPMALSAPDRPGQARRAPPKPGAEEQRDENVAVHIQQIDRRADVLRKRQRVQQKKERNQNALPVEHHAAAYPQSTAPCQVVPEAPGFIQAQMRLVLFSLDKAVVGQRVERKTHLLLADNRLDARQKAPHMGGRAVHIPP